MAKRKIYKEFYCDVYKFTLDFYVGYSGLELEKTFKSRYGIDMPIDGNALGLYDDFHDIKGDWIRVLWVKNRNDLPTLVHEVTHLVLNIFTQRYIRIYDTSHNEHFTYYIEHWFRRLRAAMR